jgi:hypothetical protein
MSAQSICVHVKQQVCYEAVQHVKSYISKKQYSTVVLVSIKEKAQNR